MTDVEIKTNHLETLYYTVIKNSPLNLFLEQLFPWNLA